MFSQRGEVFIITMRDHNNIYDFDLLNKLTTIDNDF